MKKLLNVNEVAGVLNLRVSTIYAWVHHRKIPFVKLGGKLVFIEDQIQEFVSTNTFVAEI